MSVVLLLVTKHQEAQALLEARPLLLANLAYSAEDEGALPDRDQGAALQIDRRDAIRIVGLWVLSREGKSDSQEDGRKFPPRALQAERASALFATEIRLEINMLASPDCTSK